jgi:uncharacterized paraquat-inducible protein A
LLRRLHWWWLVGILWITGYFLVVGIVLPGGFRRGLAADSSSLIPVLIPLLAGVAWLLVIAPLLEARVPRFSDHRPPLARARLLRPLAWAPTIIFGLLLLSYSTVKLFRIEDSGWYTPTYGVGIVVAFVLSIVYGRMMWRHLDRQSRDAAANANVCVRCNYDLTGLEGGRCPECGEPLPPR